MLYQNVSTWSQSSIARGLRINEVRKGLAAFQDKRINQY